MGVETSRGGWKSAPPQPTALVGASACDGCLRTAGAGEVVVITDAALSALRAAVAARDDTAVAVWEALGTAWFEAEEMEYAGAA